jgi:tRNA A37 threonylcarbamoyladenosine synthetase subunit TsaC/SUA5/YrdC
LTDRTPVGETALNRPFRCIFVTVLLLAATGMIAGCADSRVAATNSGAQASSGNTDARRSTPYQTGYGLTSDGPTTDLYTELFRSKARDENNAAATVSSGNVQPAVASSAVQPGRPASAARNVQQGQPTSVASAVQPEPATPQTPPATTTVYGIPSDGMTTDLYTELFGARSRQ